jgi:hypothetical protein
VFAYTTPRFSGALRTDHLLPLLLPMFFALVSAQQPESETKSSSKPTSTTLCEIVASPAKFANKIVSFRAAFESDGLEHSVLTHVGCKKGIVPIASDKESAELQHFDRTLAAGGPGTADRNIIAVFTGRFVWKPPSRRILEIDGVSDLQVTPAKR